MIEIARRCAHWVEDRPLALSLLALLICAATSVAMASAARFGALEAVLARATPMWLALMIAGRAAAYAGYAVAHRFTVARDASVRGEAKLKLFAYGAGATSLGGGFSVDHRALRGAGASGREATVRVLNLGALELATLAPAACVCAFLLLGSRHVQQQVSIPWAVGVPVGGVVALLAVMRLSPRSLARRGRAGRWAARALEALDMLRSQFAQPLRNAPAWLGMALYWAGEIVSLWAALRAFGFHAGVPATVLAYATGHVLTPRSLPLAGVGVTEVLLPLALLWVGVPLASAVPAVFAYRILLLSLAIPPALLARESVRRLVGVRYTRAQARRTR